ncbi:hypothetical protein DFA_04172 [Cavenderia fasciculata]|uniref:Ankyrin repeat-containing protein n=1 Tax=Cavenderia fasciculata TaxID=261658 RepID=F4Q1H5_CACFS|nr:uncharacterized protein DFA_04172 [Cavenderia fasciculata]EGG18676.1 hypothetical protein DFA_04172 [Cavenderia fasciculata]|eukprot:XP_004366580.1 hypothetical protein DFA_04172 [Cavenderia fasciculata]
MTTNNIFKVPKKNRSSTTLWLKGQDIIKLPHLEMISKYGMSWDFIKHYLPNKDNVSWLRRLDVITSYCLHPNATLDTLKHLLEWSPDYDITKGLHINLGSTSDTLKKRSRNIQTISNRDILEYLIQNYPNVCLKGIAENAAKCGYLPIIELLNSYNIDIGLPFNRSKAMHIASVNGQFNIMRYLHDFIPKRQVATVMMDHSSKFGNLEMLKFLHENRSEGCSTASIHWAAINGHFEVVKN